MSNDDILFRLMRLKFFKNFKHNNNNKGHIPYSCLFAICCLMKLKPVTRSCNIIEIFLNTANAITELCKSNKRI